MSGTLTPRRSPWLGEGDTSLTRGESGANCADASEGKRQVLPGFGAAERSNAAHKCRRAPWRKKSGPAQGAGPRTHQEDGKLFAHAAARAARTRRTAAGARGRPRLLVRLEVRRLLELILGHRGLQLGRFIRRRIGIAGYHL